MGAAASPWLSLSWSQHWGCPSINLCSPQLPLPFSSVAIPTTPLTPSLNLSPWLPGLGPHLSAFSPSLLPEAGSGPNLSRPLTPRFPFKCPQGPSRKQKRVRWKVGRGRWQPGSQAHPEGPGLQHCCSAESRPRAMRSLDFARDWESGFLYAIGWQQVQPKKENTVWANTAQGQGF